MMQMLTIGSVALSLALALTMAALACDVHRQQAKADPHSHHAGHGIDMTVSGEVVDIACFLSQSEWNGDARTLCARRRPSGKIVDGGLVTGDGTLFVLLPDHGHEEVLASIGKMASSQIVVTGRRSSKGGFPAIVCRDIKKLEEARLLHGLNRADSHRR